jgi:lysosomal acid lipase/cholesteryl ester hydrolase
MKAISFLIGAVAASSDATKSVQEICSENGFLFEEHFVTTEDGYILQLHRIPGIINQSEVE